MKCPYCGGEFSSQSIKCPFCGRENAEGIAFQNEIQKRIERNRLLRPFLIKQKTPELVQRMLTRIFFVIAGVNILLIAFSLGFYMWSQRESDRIPEAGSQAKAYETEFLDGADVSFITEFLEDIENKRELDRNNFFLLVGDGYAAMRESRTMENREETVLLLRAFFQGYLKLSEEEAAFLDAAAKEDAPYFPDSELEDIAVAAIEENMKEVAP